MISTILPELDRTLFEPMLCLWRDEIAYPIPDDVTICILKKYKPWHLFRAILRTRSLVKGWKPDIVYSHLSYVNLLTGLALQTLHKRPIWIPCEHNNPALSLDPIRKKILGTMLRRSDKIVAVSNGVRKACITILSLSSDKVTTIYNPLDLPSFTEKKNSKIKVSESEMFSLVAMGRLTKQKDYPTMLKALKILREKIPVRLKILGEGPLRNELKKMASDLNISEYVEFIGFVKTPFPIIKTSDVYVMSSIWEGLPMALIEAMACGVPVVSTRAAYGPEEIIVNGESGLLVNIGDYEGLADSIFRILMDHSLRKQISMAGNERVKNLFSKEKLIPELEFFFTHIAKQE